MVNIIQQLEELIALLQHEIAQLSDEIYFTNANFVISALNQYSHNDFISLIEKHNIMFHEKN